MTSCYAQADAAFKTRVVGVTWNFQGAGSASRTCHISNLSWKLTVIKHIPLSPGAFFSFFPKSSQTKYLLYFN